MSTRRLLPIFVLAIGGLVVLGCGDQRENRNRIGDIPSYTAEGGATQFMLSGRMLFRLGSRRMTSHQRLRD
jgi:hypothetical protein